MPGAERITLAVSDVERETLAWLGTTLHRDGIVRVRNPQFSLTFVSSDPVADLLSLSVLVGQMVGDVVRERL